MVSRLNQTIVYEYDSGGNIQSKKIYPLTSGELTGNPTETITYTYENSNWCDQLTAYNRNGGRAQYYVLCNSRGDVVDIYNQNGTIAAHYTYDSWGNTISIKNRVVGGREITDPTNIGILNQIRYRGYYLDIETGYYYLMSRYYNSVAGRFINADLYTTTG